MLIDYHQNTLQRFYNAGHAGVPEDSELCYKKSKTNPTTRESITFYIKIEDSFLQEASYLCRGGVAVIAVCEYLCEQASGRSFDVALNITPEQCINDLEIPEVKKHSVMWVTGIFQELLQSINIS